jgi:hypothetical protein
MFATFTKWGKIEQFLSSRRVEVRGNRPEADELHVMSLFPVAPIFTSKFDS